MNKIPDTFAIFILTHGRPNRVLTYKSLLSCGYSGKIFIILDDQDKTIPEYKKIFGDEKIIIFNKEQVALECDSCNNLGIRKTILMARNACFNIARQLNITHFLQLDDDYEYFLYKMVHNNKNFERKIKNINPIINEILDFYEKSGAKSIAFAQNGDFIGGISNSSGAYRFQKRKCMNSFFCSTNRPFKFVGIMNEDVSAYTSLGSRGQLFLTIPNISIKQPITQSKDGGVTETYKMMGTYCKSFMSVMVMPSSVKVAMMPSKNSRIHHSVKWKNTVPCILNEQFKKNDKSRRNNPKI